MDWGIDKTQKFTVSIHSEVALEVLGPMSVTWEGVSQPGRVSPVAEIS